MIYDCIVIGGGPAGSVCSYILQKNGLKCLLLEKRTHIDEKTCGGFLTNKCRELLIECGISLDGLYSTCNIIKGLDEFRENNVKTYRYSKDKFGFGTFRKNLDSYLLNQSKNIGTVVKLGEYVRDYDYEDNLYYVNGFCAKKIVWAIGTSTLCNLKCLDRNKVLAKTKNQSLGISEIIRCGKVELEKDTVYFWYTGLSNDYFWAIPIGETIWNIGYWSQDDKINLKRNFEKGRKRFVDEFCVDITTLRRPKGALLGNSDFSDCFTEGSVLSCGDFAGTNNYDTGEGICQAISSAKSVADWIIQCIV